MYRRYEDPAKVQTMLEEAEAELEIRRAEGADEDELIDLEIWIYELKDRVRFAWDDDEYDSMQAMEYWYEDPEFCEFC